MSKLILHVGPGKCGSTSIQQFFATLKKPCIQNFHYKLLDPSEITELNCEEPNKSLLTNFTKRLVADFKKHDILILSHEFLSLCPLAIKNICLMAKGLQTDITIIGYSRKQSDYLISVYSQWLFRMPDRVNEAINALDKLELDSNLFTGLERQLIALIINDFITPTLGPESILDWCNLYTEIHQLAHEMDATVKCGTLPNKESNTPLIQDFCIKSGLTLRCGTDDSVIKEVHNISFNKDIIEAINIAVALGLDVPGPHEGNEIISLLSSKISPVIKDPSEFLSKLKSYIDTYFFNSNKQLSKLYGLNETYFSPAKNVSKSEILDMIATEQRLRSLNYSTIIENNRMLSAKLIELCIKQTNDIKS